LWVVLHQAVGAPQRPPQISQQLTMGPLQGRSAPDQHIIMVSGGMARHHRRHRRPQTPLGTIACHGVANLFAGRKTNTHNSLRSLTSASWMAGLPIGNLQDKARCHEASAGPGHAQKIRAPF
jgi:hypothetical protein